MTRSTPTIHDAILQFNEEGQESSIFVGSTQWFEWLDKETSTIFSFHSPHGSYTACKERAGNRRGGWYWKAYRKYQGSVYRAYLGKSEDLTVARLNEIARTLSARMHRQARGMPGISEAVNASHRLKQWDETTLPLLETKFHPPRLPVLLIERSRLLTLLDAGQRQKLILLHAPAGFGKTTLVAQWIAHRQAQAAAAQHKPAPVAWLSLDSGDNDPVRFWSSIIAAYQSFHTPLGQAALAHLSQAPLTQSPLETSLSFLLNDLARSVRQGVLILEDYHLIEYPRIHETMAFFIEHLPASLQVVILTRVEPPLPLVRWLARGDLLEVQSRHLRFSMEETASFLQQVIPPVLSQEAVRSLHTHLEGWAAGLRLLVLSLQGHTTPQAIEEVLLRLTSGSTADRTRRSIQEFFLSEVLSTQPEPLQLFLLQTSILNRLTGSLCDAVTGRQGSAERLELVEHSGFFLEALENPPSSSSRQGYASHQEHGVAEQWYRYHPLFAESMRAEAARRLREEELRDLSRRASHWYEAHAMPVEAIESALTAQEFERAAHLIEKLNERAYFSEHHTMRRWLEQLPVSLLRVHPALCFRYAQARLFPEDMGGSSWQIAHVEDLLQMAEEGWRSHGNVSCLAMLYAFRASYMLLEGNFAPAVTYAHQALQLLPPSAEQLDDHIHGRHDWRCICLLAIGMEMMQEGSFDKARQRLLEAYTLTLKSGDRVFKPIISRMLGEICIELGELHQAAEYCQQALAAAHETDEGEGIMYVLSAWGLAQLSYEWNQLEKADQLAREASFYKSRGYFLHWEEEARTKGELLRLLVQQARGEVTLVQQQLSALFVRLQAISTPNILRLIPDVLIWQARLQIRDGDLLATERTLGALTHPAQELSPVQQRAVHLLHARLHLARGEAETALPLLERLLASAQQGKHVIQVMEIQLLIALAHAALKHGPQARQQLYEVLSQAHSEGFMRLFLDEGEQMAALLRSLLPTLPEKPLRTYAQSILQAFLDPLSTSSGRAANETASSLFEPLSAQEQRVLTLLAAGRSNPEIAESLIVSVNTVKGHVKNLYRKLNVINRVQAVEVARREKLI